MVALVAVVLGVALGAICGGSIRRLGVVSLRFEWLLLVLFVVQGVARGRIVGASATSVGYLVWVASCIALLALLASEWGRAGVWVASVGMTLNVLVVLMNGGMPVSPLGTVASGISESMGFYQLAGPGTLIAMLGDVVQLGVSGSGFLVSPGDVLLALGVTAFVMDAMLVGSDSMPAADWE